MARDLMRREGGLVPFGGHEGPFELMRNMFGWDPFRELERGFRAFATEGFAPSFDVKETKDTYELRADLPGVREEDVDVTMSGNRLTISGKREQEEQQEGETWYAHERSYGSFTRSFSLPNDVDEERCEASFDGGVLTVRLAKSEAERPRRIKLLGKDEQPAKDVPKTKDEGKRGREAEA